MSWCLVGSEMCIRDSPRIARELKTLGYTGVVGLEGFASGNSGDALDKFRELLTPQ
jgi:hydroxypyruvate isomerase